MNLKALKEKKERGVSVDEVINDLVFNGENISNIFVVYVNEDNDVIHSHSTENLTKMYAVIESCKPKHLEFHTEQLKEINN